MPHVLNAHKSENQKSIDIKEALIASEIRYRRLFESARDGILILDAETGMIVDVNPFLIELLGYSKEKFLGKAIWEIGFFKDVLENKEKFLELQQKEYVRYDDLPLETFNGLTIHVEFVSNVYLANKKKVIQCNIRDITERKHAEKIIHENEEKFKKITQAANEGIILIDNVGKIVFWNKAAETIFGYSVDEAINQDLHLLLAAEKYLKKSQDGFKAFRETGKGFAIGKTMELEGKRKNGQVFPVELSISAIKISEEWNAVGIIRDISDRKEWEKQLVAARVKAEESDRLKTAFLANMSHEIRTPMNGILGFTELLKAPQLTGAEQQNFITIIEKSGARMLNIINDIINISRIEAGQIEATASNVNINEQIEDIFNFFKPEAQKENLHFSISIPHASKEEIIKTDKEKVYAVLTNLVKNALKFTHSGSIELGYKKKGDFIEFFIKDTGAGIPKEQIEVVFERFRQGNESLTRDHQGAGLGLAISKAYIEILGGKIWVESEIGQGSTFYFTIPFVNNIEKKEKSLSVEDNNSRPGRKLKILVVENDETSQLLLNVILKPYSSSFLLSISGEDGIEACRKNPDIDLIFMDINMSGIDGYEATRQIRKFNKKVIIIAQTAYALSGDRDKSLEAGCNDYISKPINRLALIEIIKKYIFDFEFSKLRKINYN